MTRLESIRGFVLNVLKTKGDRDPCSDHDPLISSGRLSSLEVMETAVFLEGAFGLDLSERGFDPADFDSIVAIDKLVQDCAAARVA
jgi:acyl carrier protein